jgi:hypothetical protein
MSERLKLEWRYSALIALIVAIYVGAVAWYADAHGALGSMAIGSLNPLMLAVFGITFGIVIAVYIVRSAWRARGPGMAAQVWRDIRDQFLRRDRLLARVTIFAGWFCMMLAFSPFKSLIGVAHGFTMDPLLSNVGPLLFFGYHGWQITHAVFGTAAGTAFLQAMYTIWFVLVWISLIYCIARADDARFRMQFMLSFLLCWIIVGSAMAYWLASAGPCFYQGVFGDARYAPLMERLHTLDQQIASIAPAWRLISLDEQNWLWTAYKDNADNFGAGISAMPSMHVAFAALMARGGFALDKRIGWLMTAYAVLIWIASVHLGWHYPIDGIVGAPMGVAAWPLAGWILKRTVLRRSEAAFALPEGAPAV